MVMKTVQRRPRKHWFADLKAEALACWVRRTTDQRLQSVIGSQVRGILLWLIFRKIRQRAQPDARVDAVVEFRITGRQTAESTATGSPSPAAALRSQGWPDQSQR